MNGCGRENREEMSKQYFVVKFSVMMRKFICCVSNGTDLLTNPPPNEYSCHQYHLRCKFLLSKSDSNQSKEAHVFVSLEKMSNFAHYVHYYRGHYHQTQTTIKSSLPAIISIKSRDNIDRTVCSPDSWFNAFAYINCYYHICLSFFVLFSHAIK